MQDLTAQMERSYRGHPAFRFDASGWEISASALATFNENYVAARQMGAAIDGRSSAALRSDCLRALDAVFAPMQSQCIDEFEIRFLQELRGECARLIQEELAWHARRLRLHFVKLEGNRARQEAIRMQVERHYFGCLSRSAIEEIRSLGAKDLDRFRVNAAAGRLTREDLSANGGAAVGAIRDVLNREFRSLGVLDAVSAYTGRKNSVIGLALELSVPQATWWNNAIQGLERPPKTLYAHLDETIACPKSIVYLTDVTDQNGPTGCYPGAYEAMRLNPLQEIIGRVVGTVGNAGDSPLNDYYAKQYHQSVSSERFRRHFMRLPESLRFNSHMGWDVAPGSELEASLAGSELQMMGVAGTFIVFDGARLLHRGGLTLQGERVALQVIFSDMTLTERVLGKVKRMLT